MRIQILTLMLFFCSNEAICFEVSFHEILIMPKF
jgi:hypothetical protein